MNKSGKGLKQIKKENLAWLCDDEDVQFLWCLVSPTRIEEESTQQKFVARDIILMDNNTRT